MLFNSFSFLFFFLPISLSLYWAIDRKAPQYRLHVLAALSLVFYSYWDWRFAPLLVCSLVANWAASEIYAKTGRTGVVTAAIAANLGVLAIFKYLNFFAEIAELLPGVLMPRSTLALPLGISFFSFHHVMYLIDLRRGTAPRLAFFEYALYIAFFPQVLAGPLVRWKEIVHQFAYRPFAGPDVSERMGRGFVLLVLGLLKKLCLADPLADIANPMFAKAAQGSVAFAEAWSGVLAFTFQIYFDFSSYTDMALGIALMFGILLPRNFDVPYRATSLQDFWRRWHMTLSRFLRDYLYIPLGGSRNGLPIQLGALFATMLLGGLWHGASWTFVAWGTLHGTGLCACVLWRRTGRRIESSLLAWLLTFGFVAVTWVFFRATDFSSALAILRALAGQGAGLGIVSWHWPLAIAALAALVGPTAWTISQSAKPTRIAAAAVATAIVAIVFVLTGDPGQKFIYFQF